MVLVVGDERSKGEWKRARVEELVEARLCGKRSNLEIQGTYDRTTNSSSLPMEDTLSSR